MRISKKQSGAMATIAMIMSLAWPTIIEQAMGTAVQYVDTGMVSSLGTQATAAVGATSTIGWLIGSTISAFSVGFLSYIARAIGAKDEAACKRTSSQAVLVVLVVGTIFTAIPLLLSGAVPKWMQVEDPQVQKLASRYFFILYLPMLPRTATTLFGTALRAAGDTKTPMKVGILVNLINVLLNFLLIYPTRLIDLSFSLFGWQIDLGSFTMPGAGMHVIGAAVASAIAFVIGGIFITIVFWRHPMLSPDKINLKPDWAILKPCMRISFPNMLQRFATSLGYVVFAAMINALGPISTAAHTIANTVESAFYIPGYGMQTAAATLAGNAYGAKDKKKMKSISAMFIPIEIGLMIFSGAALFFLANPLMNLFSNDQDVIRMGTTVLKMVALSEPVYGFSIIVEGMMMGVGKTKRPFVYNVAGMWGVRIVGTYICTQLLGLDLIAAWGCMIAHNVLLFFLYLITYIRGTWNPLNRLQNADSTIVH